jgi:hypothetical protein
MWSALAQYPNPGQGFSDAFQGGMAKNAINALMQNPNDPKALAAYGQYDPKGALNYSLEARKTQADLTAKEHKAWTETIGRAALWADTPEKRDQVVDYFIQQGHPEAAQFKQIPADQWPAVRHALVAQAGLTDNNQTQDPGIIREFDIATQRGLVPKGTTYEQYITMRNPGSQTPVVIGHNDQQVGGEVTATGPGGQKIRLNQQTGQWESVGGTSGNAGGGFSGGSQ